MKKAMEMMFSSPQGQAEEVQDMITKVMGALVALQAFQQKKFGNQSELQGLVQYAITCMPDPLRDAIVANDEARMLEIAMPVIDSHTEIKAWEMSEGVLAWIRGYVAQMGPSRCHHAAMVSMLMVSQQQSTPVGGDAARVSSGDPVFQHALRINHTALPVHIADVSVK